MAKLWGGRFSKSTDTLVDDFNSSIRFDARMYAQDIKGDRKSTRLNSSHPSSSRMPSSA